MSLLSEVEEMKNKEKYASKIIELACDGNSIAVDKRTGKIDLCDDVLCSNCLFDDNHNCDKVRREWAESEYIEKPVISKRDREFLKLFNDKCKYIARDSNGELHGYELTAMKDEKVEIWNTTAEYVNIDYFFAVDLPMVKWEDDEPWLIEDLKKLEVVEDYE